MGGVNVHVVGCRRSGTWYTEAFVAANFPGASVYGHDEAWKHAVGHVLDEDWVRVVVVKNPWAWITSLDAYLARRAQRAGDATHVSPWRVSDEHVAVLVEAWDAKNRAWLDADDVAATILVRHIDLVADKDRVVGDIANAGLRPVVDAPVEPVRVKGPSRTSPFRPERYTGHEYVDDLGAAGVASVAKALRRLPFNSTIHRCGWTTTPERA